MAAEFREKALVFQNPLNTFLQKVFGRVGLINYHQKTLIQGLCLEKVLTESTGWATTSYKWIYYPYKWPCKWITGVITPTSGVITLLITSAGAHLVPSMENPGSLEPEVARS